MEDDVYHWNGCLYVPFHTVPLSGGPFLPATFDEVEEHLELPASDFQRNLIDRYVGDVRLPRRRLIAARVHGDSMIGLRVFDRDIVIFQRWEFDYLTSGTVVIEKTAEEEGLGAWALKRLVIKVHRSLYQSEYHDEIDWRDQVIVLHSRNPRVPPNQLDPTGQYRVHGTFLKVVPRDEATFRDSPWVRSRVLGKE